jgi:alpha-D-xyloside xylohydrolase
VKVNGEDTYRAESFVNIYGSREAFYGLGQHQAGVWNYRGESVDISQDNSNICRAFSGVEQRLRPLSGTTIRAAASTTDSPTISTSARKWPTLSTTTSSTVPDFDKVIAAYRELTGQAPMFGKWAYGFWQCKNRYKSQAEILGVASKYRELHIPV